MFDQRSIPFSTALTRLDAGSPIVGATPADKFRELKRRAETFEDVDFHRVSRSVFKEFWNRMNSNCKSSSEFPQGLEAPKIQALSVLTSQFYSASHFGMMPLFEENDEVFDRRFITMYCEEATGAVSPELKEWLGCTR
jgi:hypothetical protein